MAIYQATKSSSQTEQMPGVGDGQSGKAACSSYTSTAALLVGDIIQGPLIQSGSVVYDVIVHTTGMGAAGAFEVGYGGDTDYFSAAAAAVTGGIRRADAPTAAPLILSINDTIDIRITGQGATAGVTYTIIPLFLPRNA